MSVHPASSVRTKGTSIAAIVRFVQQNWGDAGLRRLAAHVRSPETAALVTAPILAGSWYAFSHFAQLLESSETLFGDGKGTLARREGAACADSDLRGVYRVFVRFTSVGFLIERSGKVWRQYYDSGELTVLESGDRWVLFELVGFATPHRGHCETILGWCQRAGELSGESNVRGSHASCRARGDARCLFRLQWD